MFVYFMCVCLTSSLSVILNMSLRWTCEIHVMCTYGLVDFVMTYVDSWMDMTTMIRIWYLYIYIYIYICL